MSSQQRKNKNLKELAWKFEVHQEKTQTLGSTTFEHEGGIKIDL
jgi:hypothetical protein